MKTFLGGVHPEEFKAFTKDLPIERFPLADHLTILLAQHAGKPAVPVVVEGEEVIRGVLLAKADGFVSAPIHSPVTGVVTKLCNSIDFSGKPTPAIIVKPFAQSLQRRKASNLKSLKDFTQQEIIQGIQSIGMVGLGGAAFPTHVKFNPPKGKKISTLIVNGCECEPYLTADHRVMIEQSDDIVLGIHFALKALGAEKAIIAIESNKLDAVARMKAAISNDSAISVEILKTKYPQGAEKMLTTALLGKEIPSGGLPADIGVMISNVATLAEMGVLLPGNKGLIERVITVSGDAVKKPGNYLIPIGTPLSFVLETLGVAEKNFQVIFGGPMMGKSASYLETPITKGVSGILILKRDAPIDGAEQVFPCIRCAECVYSCPIHLNPSQMGKLAKNQEYESMRESFNLFDCFECGTCSYICPANIPLVQYFRLAKTALRKGSVN